MASIRRGFVTQLGMEYREALAKADEYGFDFVELLMDGRLERTNLEAEAGTFRSLAAEHDLDVLVHLPFRLDIGTPFEHVRKGSVREVKAAVETASELGAEKGVVHATSGAWLPAWEESEVQPLVLESIRTLDEFGRDHEFEICVENIPSDFFDTTDFDRVFEETDASMTLDTGHARIDGFESRAMAEFVAEHADRISHFHLNDTRVQEDEHLPFGAGTLDFERILEPLVDREWTGTLSLDVFSLDYPYFKTSLDRLDDTLERAG